MIRQNRTIRTLYTDKYVYRMQLNVLIYMIQRALNFTTYVAVGLVGYVSIVKCTMNIARFIVYNLA